MHSGDLMNPFYGECLIGENKSEVPSQIYCCVKFALMGLYHDTGRCKIERDESLVLK